MSDTLKKLKLVIIILSSLLTLSLLVLLGISAFNQFSEQDDSASVSDNYIKSTSLNGFDSGSSKPDMLWVSAPKTDFNSLSLLANSAGNYRSKEAYVSIYKNHPTDKSPFEVENMFPGDVISKNYTVKVSHDGPLSVRFHADIHDGYDKLAEVLKCKIKIVESDSSNVDGVTVYDGLIRDMPAAVEYMITSSYSQTTYLTYEISVYLDTSVGNEYMNQELYADFVWWVYGYEDPPPEDDPEIPDIDPDDPDVVDPEEPGEAGFEEDEVVLYGVLTYPAGILMSMILIPIFLIILVFVLIVFIKKKKKESEADV